MIRVKVREVRLFTNINPTEVAIVATELTRILNDHFDPKELRARKKWRETVDVEHGSRNDPLLLQLRLQGRSRRE